MMRVTDRRELGSGDLLEAALQVLIRERDWAYAADRWGEGQAKDIAYDVVDMVKRVSGHFSDSYYAQEKALDGLRRMAALWLLTVTQGRELAEPDDLRITDIRDELDRAIDRAFTAVRDASER